MNTKKIIAIIIAFVVIIVIAWMGVRFSSGPKNIPKPSPQAPVQKENTVSEKDAEIKITAPLPDAVVKSPLEITGQAKGSWYFEAVFPVKLVDDNGQELARGQAQAQQDWMSVGFVPFKVTLTFVPGAAKTGKIIFQNDNPSGQPETAKILEVPVRF